MTSDPILKHAPSLSLDMTESRCEDLAGLLGNDSGERGLGKESQSEIIYDKPQEIILQRKRSKVM